MPVLGNPTTRGDSDAAGRRLLGGRSAGLLLGVLGVAVVLILASGGLHSSDPDRVWTEAQAALRGGRLEAAQTALKQLKRLREPTPLDWLLRAQVATAFGREDEALEALGNVPEAFSLAAEARLLAGRIERRLHRLRAAEASLRAAVARNPALVEAHKELVYIFGIQLRKREIDAEFKALARLQQLRHHDLFTWGLTHFTAWDPGIGPELEAAIAADRDDRHSRLALATLLFDQPEKEQQVRQILEPLAADDADAAALRIELELARGRLTEAHTLLENAPRGTAALARLRGRDALLRRDPAGAVRHFREALSDLPCDRVAISELGRALLLTGDKAAADACFASARRLDDVYTLINRVNRPDRANSRGDLVRLGSACEAAGLLEEAKGWYELAIAQDPFDAQAQQGLHRLKSVAGAPSASAGARGAAVSN